MRYLIAMDRRRLPIILALWAVAVAAVSGLGCASIEGARLFRSGSQALDRGDAVQAVAELEQAALLTPDAAPVFNNLGVAYLAAGRSTEAERAFEHAVALDCSHEPAQRNLRALRDDEPRPQ
ncbi:MAG: tetratricopeptide repeat protein [bacterium]|nr:tetratricopeptide repeat protein [bacterium]MCP5070875.1 tetratricopeptide repeat protein [bacterium]